MEQNAKSDGWWAPIRVGLVTDPKHQARMGTAIWLYLYLHAYADRSTGRLFRDREAIAKETGRNVKTIGRHLDILREKDYIKTRRGKYGLSIEILKWKSIIKGDSRKDISVPSENSRKDIFVPEKGHSCPLRKDIPVPSHIRKLKKGFKESIKKGNLDKNWGKTLQEIESQILPRNFETLFQALAFGGIHEGKARIFCPSEAYRVCLSENYSDLIGTVAGQVFGEQVTPVFLLDTG